MSEETPIRLPVLPATCGECDFFEAWNDGSCLLAERELVVADRQEAPPENCPMRPRGARFSARQVEQMTQGLREELEETRAEARRWEARVKLLEERLAGVREIVR